LFIGRFSVSLLQFYLKENNMSEPFIGQIQIFGFNFAPRGWAFCDGQLLPIAQYSALFSLLGTTYGGDGRTTFALPDMRSRTPVHPGTGPGLDTIRQGQKGGAPTSTLTVAQMPSHNHTATATATTTVKAFEGGANRLDPQGNAWAEAGEDIYSTEAANVNMQANLVDVNVDVTVNNNGGSQPISIRDPFLGVYFCIALQGIFPSRD
jgi:microcystin-dependent protein